MGRVRGWTPDQDCRPRARLIGERAATRRSTRSAEANRARADQPHQHATCRKKTCLSSLQVDPGYGAAGPTVAASVGPSTKGCASRWGLHVLELTAPACWAQGTCSAHVFHEIANLGLTKQFKVT